ncbi:MAG: hypothetical protein KDK34_02870 [Leptospiraceae bacterium]|nr:hypothetical protein [Leptospiraceae bacterium]
MGTSAQQKSDGLQVRDLLFFDNLALYYVFENTPPRVLGRAFNCTDGRLSGSLLGLMNPKQRETVHAFMIMENDDNESKNADAIQALTIIARDLLDRGFIRKQGLHYFGTPGTESLQSLS